MKYLKHLKKGYNPKVFSKYEDMRSIATEYTGINLFLKWQRQGILYQPLQQK